MLTECAKAKGIHSSQKKGGPTSEINGMKTFNKDTDSFENVPSDTNEKDDDSNLDKKIGMLNAIKDMKTVESIEKYVKVNMGIDIDRRTYKTVATIKAHALELINKS